MSDKSDWIQHQLNVHLSIAFVSLHRRLMKDVRRANKLIAHTDWDRRFEVTDIERKGESPHKRFFVKRMFADTSDQVSQYKIEISDQGMEMYLYDVPVGRVSQTWCISTKWDEEKMQCMWIVNDKTYTELWQVSRKILGTIFPSSNR